MDKYGIKASLYDLFGYFLPGCMILILIFIMVINFNMGIIMFFTDLKKIQDILILKYNNILFLFLIILVPYILGHLLSTLSSVLFESLIIKKIKIFKNMLTIKRVMPDKIYYRMSNKFENQYKIPFENDYFRLLICNVEKKHPQIHSTALVFLSIYGMARNITLIFMVMFIAEHVLFIINLIRLQSINYPFYSLIYIFIFVVSFFEYIRFRKYYIKHIINGYLVNEN